MALSPSARAVYDAFNRIGLCGEPSFATDRKALAAAFRAAVDHLAEDGELEMHNGRVVDADSLLSIANELEEQ